MLPLEGIKVLDLSRLAPGPYCTMLLADFGADVVLVEEAGSGAGRRAAVAGREDEPARARRAAAFNALGRGKRSIRLNLKDERSRDIFYRLCRDADVVVEGFRPGVVKRLGVDYETVAKINPGIVYCSLSGYGQTGPYAKLVGHDINYISIAGLLGVTGWPGQPPAIPVNVGADFAGGGLFSAFAISVALLARGKTGRGQYIDMAMSDGVLSLLTSTVAMMVQSGRVLGAGDFLINGAAPFYNVFQAKDGGWFSLGAIEPWFYENLCRAMGREDFIDHQYNHEKYPEIFAHFREKFRERTRQEWFEYLSQWDICAAPVLRLDETMDDPHNRARDMRVELEHPDAGKVMQVGIAPKLSGTPGNVRGFAPVPGEHTDEVLRSLGYEAAAIGQLRADGAIA